MKHEQQGGELDISPEKEINWDQVILEPMDPPASQGDSHVDRESVASETEHTVEFAPTQEEARSPEIITHEDTQIASIRQDIQESLNVKEPETIETAIENPPPPTNDPGKARRIERGMEISALDKFYANAPEDVIQKLGFLTPKSMAILQKMTSKGNPKFHKEAEADLRKAEYEQNDLKRMREKADEIINYNKNVKGGISGRFEAWRFARQMRKIDADIEQNKKQYEKSGEIKYFSAEPYVLEGDTEKSNEKARKHLPIFESKEKGDKEKEEKEKNAAREYLEHEFHTTSETNIEFELEKRKSATIKNALSYGGAGVGAPLLGGMLGSGSALMGGASVATISGIFGLSLGLSGVGAVGAAGYVGYKFYKFNKARKALKKLE